MGNEIAQLSDTDIAWTAIRARGPQAESFLQGQLSQDVTALKASGSWALVLSPDSAVLSTCFVQRDGDDFTLLVPRSLGDAVSQRLRRFKIRVDCTLEVGDATGGPYSSVATMVDARWPGEHEFAAQLTPQSFGSHFVTSTVSFTKGCYTGQELVSRLDARGSSVPWRFVHVLGPSVERLNDVLRSKGHSGPAGVTTAVQVKQEVRGLGFAHRSLLGPGGLDAFDDVSIEEVP